MYSERMSYIGRERVRDRFTKTEIFWKGSYFGYLDILCVCVCVCVCVLPESPNDPRSFSVAPIQKE